MTKTRYRGTLETYMAQNPPEPGSSAATAWMHYLAAEPEQQAAVTKMVFHLANDIPGLGPQSGLEIVWKIAKLIDTQGGG